MSNTSTETLINRARVMSHGDPRRERLVAEVVRRHEWLARSIAARYSGRGEDNDVLKQEAYVGLMEAIARFDSRRGAFVPYAGVTVRGVIRRHFRDRRRWVRLPRHLQEVQAELREIFDEYTQSLRHRPSNRELAAHLNADESAVSHANSARFRPYSLDVPMSAANFHETFGDRLSWEEPGFDRVVDLEAVRATMPNLSIRQRQMLLLHFFGNFSQREIAIRFGLSQMHISRLIKSACAQIRHDVLETADDA